MEKSKLNKGFVQVRNEIINQICEDERLGKNSRNCCLAYIVLYSHWVKKNGIYGCYPSLGELAKRLNTSPRNISRYIDALADAGYIEISSGKQGVCNNYFFPYEEGYEEEKICNRRKGKLESIKEDN